MGARLVKYFEYAKQKGGVQAQMRLAMKFGMASPKAAVEPDSPQNLQRAQAACKEVLGDPNVPAF